MKLSILAAFITFVPLLSGQYTYNSYETNCSDCPTIGRTNGEEETSNYNPKLEFSCYSNHPIDWVFHYDEDEQVEIQKRTLEYKRDIRNFINISEYNYEIHATIEYPQRLQHFPNFTCFRTEEKDKLTRIVISGNEEFFKVAVSTSPNDYVVKKPSPNCGAFNYFAIASKVPYINGIGPCFNCFRTRDTIQTDFDEHLVPKKYTCSRPSLCQSLWQFKQQPDKKCMYTSAGADFDRGCLGNQRDEIFCFVKDERSCFVSNDLNPFLVSCRGKSESSVLGAQLGFYGVNGLDEIEAGNFTARPIPYFNFGDAPKTEMIELKRRNKDSLSRTYLGQEVEFQCKISSYYCAWPIWISTAYEGESPQYEEMTINIYPNPDTFWNRTTVVNNKFVGEYFNAFIKLQANQTGKIQVSCYCPVFNSSEWIQTSKTLSVDDVEWPKISWLTKDRSEALIIGDVNRSIECGFSGHPISDVVWQVDEKPLNLDLYAVITQLDKNISTLWIPEVLKIIGGRFACKIVTFFSVIEDEIFLQVEEKIVPSSNYLAGTLIPIFIITLLICSFVIFRLWAVNKRQRDMLRSLTDDEIKEFKLGNPNYSMGFQPADCGNVSVQTLPFDEKHTIPFKNVDIDYSCILGKGEFGLVFKGHLESKIGGEYCNQVIFSYYANFDMDSAPKLTVAIKTVKPDVEVEYFKALLSELKMMGHVGTHANVVRLLGACTEEIRDRKLYIIVEFCVNGSLEGYLRNVANRDKFVNIVEYGRIKLDQDKIKKLNNSDEFSTLNFFKWSSDIAKGLHHVHQHNIIHGDLAIRNVLLSEDLTAKISDFGLSRQLVHSSNYVKKSKVPLPWRHMPPEAMQEKNFSKSSDIWALGVVLWEIFEMGKIPYGGETWNFDFVNGIISGNRLNKPRFATNELYEYILQCWELDPRDRCRAEDAIIILDNTMAKINLLRG